jgi:hypothetical protein
MLLRVALLLLMLCQPLPSASRCRCQFYGHALILHAACHSLLWRGFDLRHFNIWDLDCKKDAMTVGRT